MKTSLHLFVLLTISFSVSAQSYTLNWASSFSPAWGIGAIHGNAYNIGGSGINCGVNIAKSGGAFASYGAYSAPMVNSGMMSVGGSSSNILVALDYTNPSQYTDITFTFSTPVYNLSFNLGDIDRLDNTSNSYFDRVTITGTIGATTVNPTLTKYDAVTDPNFLTISGNKAYVNKASGMAGNTASDASDQKGTIKINFTGEMISSLTIHYDNLGGVISDPGVQFVGIGNLIFSKPSPLAVQLTSFEGQNDGGKNTLKWQTANESEMAYYIVERSENGRDFNEAGKVISHNSTVTAEYTINDNNVASSYYYRLKMVNNDGSFTYSKTVLVRYSNAAEVKAFPTVFTSSLKIIVSSLKAETIPLMVTDLSGKTVYQHPYKAKQGINAFSIELPASLARGQYFVTAGNGNKSIAVIKQ